jgi:membrane-bound ClpP family serine protease
MADSSGRQVVVSRPEPSSYHQVPLWTAVAILLSGFVLVVVETPSLLFFLGVVFALLGVYLLVARHVRKTQANA